jgi:hypothetical protein
LSKKPEAKANWKNEKNCHEKNETVGEIFSLKKSFVSFYGVLLIFWHFVFDRAIW